MNLLDTSGEITGVVFDHLCNTFYDQIKAGKVYLFSKFEVQRADGRYKIVHNPHQILFREETVLKESEDDVDIPRMMVKLSPLYKVPRRQTLALVDTIGICKEVYYPVNRGGYQIQELILLDSSKKSVEIMLNLWNKEVDKLHIRPGDIILVKGTRVKDHEGKKKLNFDWFSFMKINPKVPKGHPLHKKLKELMYLKNNLLKQTMFNCREILVE